MAVRRDLFRIDAPRRTPLGGLVAPAFLTRSGVLKYTRADGTVVHEWRPKDEVFKADSLDSLKAAPMTELHPDEMVGPLNFRGLAVGHVGDDVRQDGDKVAATIYVQDARAVSLVESGKLRQLSCGYTCDVDETAGTTPEGERYDRVQRNIRYNHCALVPLGRAGADVALRLDAADNQVTDEGSMEYELIEGIKYTVGTEPHRAAVARRDAAEKARHDEVAALRAEKDKQAARADLAEGEGKKLAAEILALKDPKRLDAAVKSRVALESTAKALAGEEFKTDGLTDQQVRVEALKVARPEIKLDGQSDDYVRAAFDLAAEAQPQARADADDRQIANAGEAQEKRTTNNERTDNAGEDARVRMLKRNRSAWRNDAEAGKE